MPDFYGHFADEHHPHWEVLLVEWMATMQKYHLVANDLPYWYNERANVGILAAAAWRCGYVALEEYADNKRNKKSETDNDEERDRLGRVDLWIGRPDDASGELIEAKLRWLNIGTASTSKSELQAGLNIAIDDARRSKTGKGATLGLTFFVPGFAADNNNPPADMEQRLQALLGDVENMEASAKAWYFPEKFRQRRFQNNGQFYPGVILLAKRVWRGV